MPAVLYGCRMLFLHMADVFASPFEEMSHGWYVPLFSLYMLFRRRASLRAAFEEGAPSFAGLAAILPCLLLLWTGTRGLQIRFSQAGFIGLCIAMPWALWGRRMARLVAGPALFLVFTVPLGSFLGVLSVPLLLSRVFPQTLSCSYAYVPPMDLEAHLFTLLKSAIVLSSWIFAYISLKHLPISVVSPRASQRMAMDRYSTGDRKYFCVLFQDPSNPSA